MTAPIPAEWIKAAALAISRYDWDNTLSANGEVSQHQRNEAQAAIAAALPLIVESIAARFDERAHAAERATRDMARTERDVDAVMAWWSGARLVREHAANRSSAPAAAVSSPGGTPGAPNLSTRTLGAPQPAATGICETCGGHVVYNLAIGYVDHPYATTCTTPWPATSPTGDPTP